eukprot:TRINITY_DN6799_c0_g1_i1.p1 TRINITY_DN6799_c0_g1~~TRINITY_DN6799_c0_g1_i1.p1  ORF type:complete len:149 (-),score=18.02 TRINITY_DN6799_c0_g1_i1:405-851(-)
MMKENKRNSAKNEKLNKEIKRKQHDAMNGKEVNRKLGLTQKRLQSLQRKQDKLNNAHNLLKEERSLNIKEMKQLKEARKDFEHKIENMQSGKSEILNELNTEKEVVTRLQSELMKYHHLNGQQLRSYKKQKKNIQPNIQKRNRITIEE